MVKVVIPSHKRADRVKTLKLVPDAILCVEEAQVEEYRRHNPGVEVVAHPNDVVGLVPKRNWMAKHFGDLFMLDDDVTIFRRIYIEAGESAPIRDPKVIRQRIEELHELAVLLGVHLYGFGKKVTPTMYNEFEPISLRTCVTGCSYGVIANENTVWNEAFQLKEDFFISCYVKHKERVVLVDNRYNFTQENTMTNSGGLAAIRNQETERENVLRLRQFFGEVVSMKKAKTNGKDAITDKSQYNITVNFPM